MDRVQNCFSYGDSNNFQLNTPVLLPRVDLYHYTTEKIATRYYTTIEFCIQNEKRFKDYYNLIFISFWYFESLTKNLTKQKDRRQL